MLKFLTPLRLLAGGERQFYLLCCFYQLGISHFDPCRNAIWWSWTRWNAGLTFSSPRHTENTHSYAKGFSINALPRRDVLDTLKQQPWASYFQNVVHYIYHKLLSFEWIRYITIVLSLNCNAPHYLLLSYFRGIKNADIQFISAHSISGEGWGWCGAAYWLRRPIRLLTIQHNRCRCRLTVAIQWVTISIGNTKADKGSKSGKLCESSLCVAHREHLTITFLSFSLMLGVDSLSKCSSHPELFFSADRMSHGVGEFVKKKKTHVVMGIILPKFDL